MDIAAFLKAPPELPEDTVPMCLRRTLGRAWELADAEYQGLQGRYDKDVETKSATQGDGAAVRKAKRAADDARRKVEEASSDFIVRALPSPEYKTLKAKYPPRDGNVIDRQQGWNFDEFPVELLKQCLAVPQLDAAQFDALLERITDAQLMRLMSAAVNLNEGEAGAGWVPSFR